MIKNQHLLLIDGSNQVFRAYHAIKILTNAEGLPTNAILGYVNMLRSILVDQKPTHIAVAFDPKGGGFRREIYAEYKAQRPPMPEDLAVQWPYVHEISKAYGVTVLNDAALEADDLIATLATQADAAGWRVSIISTDKDLMQLVSERVHLLDMIRKKTFDTAAVQERWGVPPNQLHDLLALAGDSSDNIPGVPGVGVKTAAQLLTIHGNLENVLAAATDMKKSKRRENLINHADDARLSYRLVELRTDADVPALDDLIVAPPDADKLLVLFRKLNFKKFSSEFAAKANKTSNEDEQIKARNTTDIRCHIIDGTAQLEALVAGISQTSLLAIDTETTSLHTHDAELVGISLAIADDHGWYIPLAHRDGLLDAYQLPCQQVLDALRPVLENPDIAKCGHNLKYDLQVLARANINMQGISHDSMLLAYTLHPGGKPPSLDNVAEQYLNHKCTSYEEIVGKGKKQLSFADIPLEKAAPYAVEDAVISFALCKKLPELLPNACLKHYQQCDLPLLRTLADMEWQGVCIDKTILADLSFEFAERLAKLETEIHTAAGKEFNIHSPRQLGEVLFDDLELPGGKRTPSGQWRTDQNTLETLANISPLAAFTLQSRSVAKLKSTYADALGGLVYEQTGRVHTSFNQAITSTGRLSSSNPNLQNIPIRSEDGRRIRRAFIAPAGRILIAADYSQIELRLMAHFSKDPALCAAFIAGEDIHAATAAQIENVPLDAVDSDMRRSAKAVNFGILYGMSAFGLAKLLSIPRKQAQIFIDTYFNRFAGVRVFMDEVLVLAKQQEYVETLYGHRVPLSEINSRQATRRKYAERSAINAPLQGSAADIIKLAMIEVHKTLAKDYPETKLLMQVHDELIIEAPESQAEDVTACVQHIMQNIVSLRIPLLVDVGIGNHWLQAHA
ncbi:MAG: DNA polymerase I [Mariprofundales bacterium]